MVGLQGPHLAGGTSSMINDTPSVRQEPFFEMWARLYLGNYFGNASYHLILVFL
jgi:hypothetical protein